MTRAGFLGRLEKELAVRTYGLKTMVFNEYGLAQKDSENHGEEKRACEVNDVGSTEQVEKRRQTRPAHDIEG
jgi:hypothetical protein